jgi:tetratricopeptide (TPR) repeat protein
MAKDKDNVIHVSFGSTSRADELYEKAAILDELGDDDAAMKLYERVVEINPKHTSALINMGTVCVKQNNLHCAEKYYYAALKTNPKSIATLYNIGYLLYEQHPYAAMSFFERAIDINPKYLDAVYMMGLCLHDVNEEKKACVYWQRYVDNTTKNDEYKENALHNIRAFEQFNAGD